jgi:hypothetical protein
MHLELLMSNPRHIGMLLPNHQALNNILYDDFPEKQVRLTGIGVVDQVHQQYLLKTFLHDVENQTLTEIR